MHEETLRGTAREVLDTLGERVKGEIVLVVAPVDVGNAGGDLDAAGLLEAGGGLGDELLLEDTRVVLEALLAAGLRTKEASAILARLSGLDRRAAYRLAQEAKARRRGSLEGAEGQE